MAREEGGRPAKVPQVRNGLPSLPPTHGACCSRSSNQFHRKVFRPTDRDAYRARPRAREGGRRGMRLVNDDHREGD